MLALPPELTMAQARAELGRVEAELAQGGALRIDASALSDFDTGAIALLLHARRLAAARGAAFELVDAPEGLAQLARLYGVAALLGLEDAGSVPA